MAMVMDIVITIITTIVTEAKELHYGLKLSHSLKYKDTIIWGIG